MPSLIRKRTWKSKNKRGAMVKRTAWAVAIPTGATREDGSPRILRKTFKLERDAKEFLEKKNEEKRDEGQIFTPSDTMLPDYLADWLETTETSRRENTHASYYSMVNSYLCSLVESDVSKPLDETKLCNLKTDEIQGVYTKLQKDGLSNRTVRYVHSILHNALAQAVNWGKLKRNPADGVALPAEKPTREGNPLNEDQAKLFVEAARACDDEGEPIHRLGAFFELAIITGMRPSELFALHWENVDLKGGAVRVRHSLVRFRDTLADGEKGEWKWRLAEPKTARGKRTIPIPPGTVESLREWKVQQAEQRMEAGGAWKGEHNPADGFVFTTLTGKPLEIRNVALRDLTRLAKAIGLVKEIPPKPPRRKPTYKSKVTLYDLRHTCATLMIESGVNPKVASERLGHKRVAFTLQQYGKVMPTMQQDVAKKLGAMLYGNGR